VRCKIQVEERQGRLTQLSMSGATEILQIILFCVLLIVELYLFALVFSAIDESKFRKFILVGPLAFLVPGVLSRRGLIALFGLLLVTVAIMVLGIESFQIGTLP
jgi:hypothetical protein